jgi:hypothetical protein
VTGATGAQGATGTNGDTGATGPEGKVAELEWHDVELGEKVENWGGEYAPAKYAVSGDIIHLTGVLRLTGTLVAGSVLFKLPSGAQPTFKKLLWIGDGEALTTGVVVAVMKDGEVVTTNELHSTFVPMFDGTSFSKTH